MRTRTTTLVAITATVAATFAMTPATPTAPPTAAAPCADTVGRDLLTLDGVDLTVAPSVVTAPELAATADVTGEAITPHRTVPFLYTVDAAPFDQVEVTVTAEWADTPSDYDLYGYSYIDGFRFPAGTSNESNIDGGDTRVESFTTTLDDCALLDVELRSWAGSPAQDVAFTVEVTPVGDARADVTARPADERLGLYLTSEAPGNAGTPQDTVGDEYPVRGEFTEDRPTSNVPNLTTRAAVGSTIEKNPVQPWWAGSLDTFPTAQGTPSAVVWLSSASQQQDPGTVFVQLFLNGSEHTVEIPGSELTSDVRPFIVEFPAVDTPIADVSLQVSALPVASPNTASEHLGDANHTVYFDSVQYPSKLFLPIVPTEG